MTAQHGFDLRRVDLVAGGIDEEARPASDREVALGCEPTEITGAEGGGGAALRRRAPHHDFADRAGGQLAAGVVLDRDPYATERRADARRIEGRRRCVVERYAAGLGEPVELARRHAKAAPERVEDVARER